jgi:3-deoxy-manno-octulosonate cytidylyltransferase (CMP-KDO synthetase)
MEDASTRRFNSNIIDCNTCQANEARCVLVIPARFGSTRFPGKPLQLLGGRPVIEHVVRAALRSQAGQPILVATDDSALQASSQKISRRSRLRP